MTRRDLMRVALGIAAVPVAAKAVSVESSESLGEMTGAHRMDTPLTAVHPFCPRCGMAAMFMRRENFIGEAGDDATIHTGIVAVDLQEFQAMMHARCNADALLKREWSAGYVEAVTGHIPVE